MQLVCRGFYPRGGGHLELQVHSLPASGTIPPALLTQRGPVVAVTVRAFAAGRINNSVAHRMASAASLLLQKVCLALYLLPRAEV